MDRLDAGGSRIHHRIAGLGFQAWDFRPGSNFVLEMQRAASEAERTITILSPAYLNASYNQPELAAAYVQDPTGE